MRVCKLHEAKAPFLLLALETPKANIYGTPFIVLISKPLTVPIAGRSNTILQFRPVSSNANIRWYVLLTVVLKNIKFSLVKTLVVSPVRD